MSKERKTLNDNTWHMKIIGQNLKKLRKEHGLTQGDVADKLGVSFQQVQKYESGQNKLPIENLLVLKQYYNTTFESFFRGMNMGVMNELCSSEDNMHKALSRVTSMKNQAQKQKIIRVIQILTA